MLYLIGLGIWDEKDISLRGLEVANMCEVVFFETYTSGWKGDLKNIGIDAKKLQRNDLEENAKEILRLAKEREVAILVPGDPLIATTHSSLIYEAKKVGVKTHIIHSSSIFSAIGETGLQIYKFGKVATIPFYETETPYKVLQDNMEKGAHTLFLLDITEKKMMTCGEALKILLELEKKHNKNLISDETEVVVFCKAGSNQKVLKYDKIKYLLNFNCDLCVIVIPAKLHFAEYDYLKYLK